MNRLWLVFLAAALALSNSALLADTFGSGANSFDIDFVTIGNPGNVADSTGDPNPAGAVSYSYRIGTYEIPEDAVRKANAQSVLEGNPLGITLDTRGPNKPATSLSWFEAAKFVNWLNTNTGNTPAYKFDASGNFQLWQSGDPGYDAGNLFRNKLAHYFLPSDDEWYKAAFYDPIAGHYWDYPTGSDTAPTPVAFGTAPGTAVYQQDGPADVMLAGGLSPYGSLGQAGNVLEWEETESDLVNDNPSAERGVRGGAWIHTITTLDISSAFRNHASPGGMPTNAGFRIASSVPEPATLFLELPGLLAFLVRSRRKRSGP
jgi:hypothetical protein